MSHKQIMLVGSGQMGRSALAILARRLPEAKFTIVDRSAENLAAGINVASDRIEGRLVDVARDGVPAAGMDLVVNFAGPFFLGSDRVARSALEAGVSYVDVCDDAEGTATILALDEAAKRAGVSLITGGGLSPGVSNWMAASMLAQYPDLNGIKIVWIVQEKDPGGLAVLRHMLHMAVAPCPTWRDGKMAYTKGFVPETAETFEVPAPFLRVEAYDTAHPEPVTLSKQFPGLKLVECKGALMPGWANQAFSTLGRIGFGYNDLKIKMDDRLVDPSEVLWRLLWARHDRQPARQREARTQINVIGTRDGEAVVMHTINDDSDMSRGTGIGMAATALTLLLSGGPAGASGVEGLSADIGLSHFSSLSAAESAFQEGIIETNLS